jgi:hypothetical protein
MPLRSAYGCIRNLGGYPSIRQAHIKNVTNEGSSTLLLQSPSVRQRILTRVWLWILRWRWCTKRIWY